MSQNFEFSDNEFNEQHNQLPQSRPAQIISSLPASPRLYPSSPTYSPTTPPEDSTASTARGTGTERAVKRRNVSQTNPIGIFKNPNNKIQVSTKEEVTVANKKFKVMNNLYTRSNVRMLEQVVIKPVIVGKGLIMCYNQFMSITNLDLMMQEEFIFQLDPNSIPTEYLICQGSYVPARSFMLSTVQNVRFIHHKSKNTYIKQKFLSVVEREGKFFVIMSNMYLENEEESDKIYPFQTFLIERINKFQ